jgi:hypothetical protein
MRYLGPALIIGGALGAAVAMFFPVHGFGGEDWTSWEYFNGLDIALLAACVIAATIGLAAVITDRARLRQLAAVGGAMTFGLAFALVPGAIDDSYFYRAGLWIVAATASVALVGAVVTILAAGRQPARPANSSSRWRLASFAITTVGLIALAAMAIADPFGGTTAEATSQVPDVDDAAKLTLEWAAEHKRPGERFVLEGCTGDGTPFEARWACHVRFEPTRRLVTVYVRTRQNMREQKVVQVRSGKHSLPYP